MSFKQFPTKLVMVQSLADFPTPVAGVITLADFTVYNVIGTVNIGNNRFVYGIDSSIIGQETSQSELITTSVGFLFTITHSATIKDITITTPGLVFNVDGIASPLTYILVISKVAFNGGSLGTIKNLLVLFADSVIALGLTDGVVLGGTFSSINFTSCGLQSSNVGAKLINLDSTCVITSRIRIIFGTLTSTAVGVTGIEVDPLATLPVEGMTVNFMVFNGLGTHLVGIDHFSEFALFKNNRGIQNSVSTGLYSMNSNAVATVIPNTVVYVKAAGVTVPDLTTLERFTHINNRLTYTGSIPRKFLVFAIGSVSGPNGNDTSFTIHKNGVLYTPSIATVSTTGAGNNNPVSTQSYIDLSTGDYVEVWVRNRTAANNLTVTELNVAVNSIE